jgi:hypothetical protein
MNRSLHYFVFFVGLAAMCWVGAGYIGSSPLALAITVLVGAFYLMGVLELHRFQQPTSTLERAVADLRHAHPNRGPLLEQLRPPLRNAVRLRIEDARGGQPGPDPTP